MKNYVEKSVPAVAATTQSVLDHVACDICGAKTVQGDWPLDSRGQKVCRFQTSTVTMSLEEVTHYPEGNGSKESVAYDICPPCFRTHLIPAMTAFKATPTIEESDW